jgi:hypothetical protein
MSLVYNVYGYGSTKAENNDVTLWKDITAEIKINNKTRNFEIVGFGFSLFKNKEYYYLINTIKSVYNEYYLIKTLYEIKNDKLIQNATIKYKIIRHNLEDLSFVLNAYTNIHGNIDGEISLKIKEKKCYKL